MMKTTEENRIETLFF